MIPNKEIRLNYAFLIQDYHMIQMEESVEDQQY